MVLGDFVHQQFQRLRAVGQTDPYRLVQIDALFLVEIALKIVAGRAQVALSSIDVLARPGYLPLLVGELGLDLSESRIAANRPDSLTCRRRAHPPPGRGSFHGPGFLDLTHLVHGISF